MAFIGREEELNFLEGKYASEKAELIFLYGKRRVGKTETLREFCRGKNHLFYSCTESIDRVQLDAFGSRLLARGIPAAHYISRFENWETALASVPEMPGTGKKLLVIDEFPYMIRNNSSLPSILQNLWDSRLKNENIMIVLCGSAMSFIEKEILAEKNPLYGRATGILKMLPMDFYDAIRFFPKQTPEELVFLYSILGGIPYYLTQFDPKESLENNIREHLLHRGSVLYNEVEFLVRQEFREPALYNSIIETIALGNTKLNDIHQKTQMDRSKLSVYLRNLLELGLIEREFSLSDGMKERANVQRGLYQLVDKYFRFWYTFIFPNISELETGDSESVYRYVIQPQLDFFASHVFEEVCRSFLRRLNRKERLPFHFTRIGRWWNKSIELDIMATEPTGTKILLGECKYRNTPFSLSDFQKMKEKYQPSGSETKLYYQLFSKSGFSPDLKKLSATENLTLYDLKEIVQT